MKFARRFAFMARVMVLFIIMGFAVNLNAQPSEGGTPPSFEEGRSINAVGNYNIDDISIYPPNVDALLLEDKDRGKNGLPPRVGTNVSVDAGLNTAGSWTTRPDGSRVWILKITSEGAIALNFIFDDFHLAPGTKMFIYNENKKQVLGAFTHNNNKEHGGFTTTKIQGETVFIEYFEPAKTVGTSSFHIESAGYFYNMSKQLARLTETYGNENSTKTVGASDDCEVNINCSPVGDDWQDEKRGVAQITFLAGGSWYLCTGSLVNNTNYDETPYFLTAFHCGAADASDTELLSWEFHFNYESPDCTDPASEPATDDIIGATRIAEGNISGGSDFFLLQLESTPDGTFSPYYNGWDNTGNTSATGAGIHHPSGDIKKISTYGSISPSGNNNIGGDIMAANSSWAVTWESNDNGWGVTEGGSSGSPLFRDNGLIIGTLTGGSSSCTDQTASDVYGRFEYHWTSNGTTDDEQLQPWLDPANSGATTLGGYDPFATAPPTVDFTADRTNLLEGDAVNYTDLSLSPSGPITGWSWVFDGGTPNSSTNENPTNIVYNTAGEYDVSLAATNANGTNEDTAYNYINVIDPSVTTCDTFSQWCCNASIYISAEGYVAGTNEYGIQEVAEYFPDAYPYNTLTGARFYFAQVTSGTNPDITFKVYSDNAGQPDQVITSTTVSLSTIETAYNADGYYDLVLPESVAYPDNAFYVGFTVPGTQASGDTIALATNNDADSDANTGYSLYDGIWETYSAWGMSLQNMVFPNVCHDVSLAPVASFEGVPQMVNAGSSVAFTDLSFGGTPTSWEWTFTGAATTSSTQQNPNITYNTPGVYDVKLVVSNANGTDSVTRSGYITVVDPNTCSCSQLGHVVGGEVLYITGDGYLAGTNGYTDNAKAEYFDDYGSATKLEGAYFHFGRAYAANTGTMITFNVYADDGGASAGGTYTYSPGTILETLTVPLDDIVSDVNNGDSTYIAFDPPMVITDNFFIGYEIPYAGDSLGLMTGAQNAGTDEGWEQWSDNDWYSMTGAGWGGSFNMAIYPVVCTEGAPLPEFSADNTTIMAGGTVNYTDMSTCGATGWDWTFDGGTPGTSTNQNPSVVYNSTGTYDVSLVVSNAQGSNPMQKSNYITVLQPIVWWDFPNNPDDKISDGGIAANDGTKSLTVVGGVDAPTFDAGGATTQAAEASGWDAGANTKAWVVEFETTNYVNLKLSSKQSGDNRSPQDFKIQYSLDNATWTDVTGGAVAVAQDWTTGVVNSLSLPAACENQASVYIRWIMTSNTGLDGNINGNRSSYIDDIYVVGELSAIPPVADFSADQTTVCEGATVNFSDASTESPTSWSWSFTGGTPTTSTAQNPSVVYNTAGTYEVSLTATNSAGTDTETKTGYITVNPNPSVSASNAGPYCETETIQLNATGSGGDTWAWTGPNSYTSNTEDPSLASATLAMAGDYTVTHTNSTTGCSAQATTAVTVNANPGVTTSYNGPICEGSDLLLNATPGTAGLDFAWSGPDGFTSTIEDPSITATTTAADGNYTVVVTDPGTGCTSQSTIYAFVNANPTLSASNTGAYCSGEDIQLNATGSGGTSYNWTGPDGFTSTTEDPLIASSTTAMAGTYTVELENTTTGCIATATTDVAVNQTPDITAANSGPICEGADLTLNATTSFAGMDFSWTGPNTFTSAVEDPVITAATTAADGTYTVVVTDPGSGCSNSASTTAAVNANPTVSAANVGPYCAGESIQLTATGSGGTSYSWAGPDGFTSTTEDPLIASSTTAMAGTYTVELENTTTGCIATATTDVTVNPIPDITAANSGPICAGTDLVLNATNTSGGVDFAWSGPNSYTSTLEDPVITAATTAADGSYTVVVTDQVTGCTNSAPTTAIVNANPVISAANDGPACAGETVNLTATGSGGDVYNWSGPDAYSSNLQNPSISNVQLVNAGTYTVNLENSTTGCVSSATTVLSVNALPVISGIGNTGPYCENDNAQLNSTVSGGDTYAWSGPDGFTSSAEDPAISNIQLVNGGVYTLNYTNSTTGCAAVSQTTTVDVNALPTVSPGNTGPYCEGDDIQLEGNTIAGATYAWSGPNSYTSTQEDPLIAGAALADAGTYTLEITSADGCVAQATTDVTVNANPVVDLGADVTQCAGTNLTMDAGAGFSTYNWSTGATSQTITVNTAATYSVTVSNASACTDVDAMVFDYYPATTLAMSSTNETSAGANDGSATATPTGTSPFDYLWDTGATTQTITGLAGGLYYVTVTDGNGCDVIDFVNVTTDNTPPVADFSAGAVNVCAGTIINFTDLSTNSPTSWSWDFGGGATNATVQNPSVEFSTPGTYDVSLTVTNADGSDTEVKTAYITVNANPTISASNAGPYCEGNDVQLTATGSGGDAYAWSGPNGFNSTTEDPVITSASISAAGTYTVELSNTLTGCVSSATTDLTINSNPTVSASNTGAYCEGEDVEISATGTGGDTYTWTGPDAFTATGTAQTITSATTAADGIYEVTHENSTTGCVATAQTTVVVNPNPTLSASNTGDYCPGEVIELNATGTNGTSYEWNGPDGFTSFVEAPTITNAQAVNAGVYTVNLTNTLTGCQASATTNVVVNAVPDITASNAGPYCEGDDLQLNAESVSGDAFIWNGPNGFTSGVEDPVITAAGAAYDGTYTVEVSNSTTGCTASATTTVAVNTNPALSASNTGPYCEGDNIALNATGSGGTVYSWNGPDGFTSASEDPVISGSVAANAGNYFVTLENSGTGCSTTVSTTVNVNPNPVVLAYNAGPYCAGETAGLSAIGSGGDTYTWTGPNTYSSTDQNPVITGAALSDAGTYDVMLTNTTTGCQASASTVVEVNANPTVDLGADVEVCDYTTLTLDAGAGFNYNWSTGENTQTITPAVSDTYSVVITDPTTGCTATDQVVVTINEAPVLTTSTTPEYGSNGNDGTATVSISGGVAPYSTIWSGGQTTETITGLSGGSYDMTVTDANGCSATAMATVNTVLLPPVAGFTANVTEGCAPLTVNFTDTSTNNPVSWTWDFGDGNTSSDQNPTHTFTDPGTYTVELTATNVDGSDSETMIITVYNNPVVDLGADVDACMGSTVTLDAGAYADYIWTGGETTQTVDLFSDATYGVTVTDVNGCQGSDEVNVVFHALPDVDLGADQTICEGETVTFDAGAGYDTYNWASGQDTQTITVDTQGEYAVAVTDTYGCSGGDTVALTVNPLPVLNLPDAALLACINEPFEYTLETTYDEVIWPDGETDQTYSHTYTDVMIDTLLVTVGNNGCYVTDTLIVDAQSCSFVEESKYMNLSFYPNPTSSIIYLDMSGYRGELDVQIFNAQGQQIHNESYLSDGELKLDFDMSPHVPGVYFYRITTKVETFYHKVIRQ